MKNFTSQEDEVIKEMYEIQGIKKWGMIANVITEKFGIARNSKQCRDRYMDWEVDIDNFWTLK